MSDHPVFIMAGLPDSGKSTFLGALYHALRHAPKTSLHLSRDPEERDYLLELERRWLTLTPLDRSRHHGAKDVQIPLKADAEGDEFVLAIPDVVGEDYRDAWMHGGWDDALADWLRRADGFILFLRADTVRDADLISVDPERSASPEVTKAKWDPLLTPTQAMLCDLLEQIAALREGRMAPIAVVVSAWDTVAEAGLSPSAWLEWRTPLLWQWLLSNEEDVASSVSGISAQGGDVSQEAVRLELAGHIEDRPLPKNASPLATPLEWLLERGRR